jgi:hypothetical protein
MRLGEQQIAGVPEDEQEFSFLGIEDTDDDDILQDEQEEKKESAPDKSKEYEELITKYNDLDKQLKQRAAEEERIREQVRQSQQNTQDPAPLEDPLNIPPRPEPPKKPVNFSQQEAFSDPSSESAKYIMEKLEYQDAVNDWSTQLTAIVAQHYENKIGNLTTAMAGAVREQDENLKRKTIYDNAVSTLQRQHGLNYEEATEFIKKMEDPKSVTLTDLVAIYKNQKGIRSNPSDDFRQMKKAQNYTTPMSIQPNRESRDIPEENKILQNIIKDANRARKLW